MRRKRQHEDIWYPLLTSGVNSDHRLFVHVKTRSSFNYNIHDIPPCWNSYIDILITKREVSRAIFILFCADESAWVFPLAIVYPLNLSKGQNNVAIEHAGEIF